MQEENLGVFHHGTKKTQLPGSMRSFPHQISPPPPIMLHICCHILEQHLTGLDVAGAFSGLSEHKGEPLWTTVGDTTPLIQHVSVWVLRTPPSQPTSTMCSTHEG